MQAISFKNKRILLSPLDWGLGHAARCVPLVKHLQEQNNIIIIACNENQKKFLQNEISDVEFVDLFGYNVSYSKNLSLGLKILLQFPRLCFVVRKENFWLKKYLKENKIDVVISDNRFGLYNKNVESIFITHQLVVRAAFFSGIVNTINHSFIKRFDQCWVPDLEEKERSLSGELSHRNHPIKNVKYIGPLSRFHKLENIPEKKIDVLILLSGVEPQRTLLEEKLVAIFTNTKLWVALVRGASLRERSFPENFSVIDIATTKQLQELFCSSQNIICRSGYSTLMDLHALGLNAILIPTTGQTEQEYLAEHWKKNFGSKLIKQSALSKEAILKLLTLKENPVAQT